MDKATDIDLDPQEDDTAPVRREVRDFIARTWDPESTLRDWWRAMAGEGWGFPTWPKEWFGRGLTGEQAAAVGEELTAAGVIGPPGGMGASMAGPVILTFGTDDQKARFLPPIANGTEFWCQFFSEPGAGSDLASVRTRAVRDGDSWIVNGQKVWNSGTLDADRGLLVVRTDPDQPKHRGLSYFLIEVRQPGIEIRPIRQMNNEAHFNETFFTDATVAHDNMLGGLNNGWAVAMATLTNERNTYAGGGHHVGYQASPGESSGQLDRTVGSIVAEQRDRAAEGDSYAAPVHRLMELAKEAGRSAEPAIRQALARVFSISEVSRFTALRVEATRRAGGALGAESSVGYVKGVQLVRLCRDLGLQILGPGGTLVGTDAPTGGAIQHMALSAPSHGIQGGSEQIQKNIIGERILGLPKEPQVDRDMPFREIPV
jgi:alkylation response protein AidB-like acyl-CoA dehydrogenase